MTKEFLVQGMSCLHCVNAVTQEVSSVQGVQNVKVDLPNKRVRVEASEQVTTETIVEAINEAGYNDVTVLN